MSVHAAGWRVFVCTATIAMCIVGWAGTALGASGILYLLTSEKSVAKGSTISISIRMNSNNAVNAVQTDLTYPSDALEYVGASFTGTAFEIQAQSTSSNGSVKIARGTTSTVTGDKLVGTVTFRAKATNGSATITLAETSALANNGVEVPSSKGSATVFFTPAASTATNTKPEPATPTTTPKDPSDTTPPEISNIRITDITTKSAVVSWATNEPADSAIEYGIISSKGLGITSNKMTKSHRMVIESPFMSPKTTYHFRVASADTAGNEQISPDTTFTTKGVPVTIHLRDSIGNTLTGATITAGDVSVKTDETGNATFELGLGRSAVSVAADDEHITTAINLSTEDATKTDTVFPITLTAAQQNLALRSLSSPVAFVIGLLLGYGIKHVLSLSSKPGGKAILRKLGLLGPDDTELAHALPHIERQEIVSKAKRLGTKVSEIEKRYGDKNPTRNPYAPARGWRWLKSHVGHQKTRK